MIHSYILPYLKFWINLVYMRNVPVNSFLRLRTYNTIKGKKKVQGVPQSQTAALPRHQEEEETDKSKQAQIDQTYEKHKD